MGLGLFILGHENIIYGLFFVHCVIYSEVNNDMLSKGVWDDVLMPSFAVVAVLVWAFHASDQDLMD